MDQDCSSVITKELTKEGSDFHMLGWLKMPSKICNALNRSLSQSPEPLDAAQEGASSDFIVP